MSTATFRIWRGEKGQGSCKLRVVIDWLRQHLAQPGRDLVATRIGDLVDRALRPASFPAGCLGRDEAAFFEALDRVIDRATLEADDLVVAPFLHLQFHFVGMHGALHQQVHDRQRERGPWQFSFSLHRLVDVDYTMSTSRCQLMRDGVLQHPY